MPHTIATTDRIRALILGILCHGIFLFAVWQMFWGIASGLTTGRGTVPAPWNLLANFALLVQFAFGHSFLLSRRGRAISSKIGGRQGAKLASTIFALITSAQLAAVFFFWSPSQIELFSLTPLEIQILFVCYGAAWLFLGRAMYDAGIQLQTGALGWWAVFRKKRPEYPPMPTRGTFRVVRQPIYLAFTLILWSAPSGSLDHFILALPWTAYLILGPLLKERRFEQFFGDSFRTYKSLTPYFIPRLFRKPK